MNQQGVLHDAAESSGIALGLQVTSAAPPVIEVSGDLGLDFAWIDLEHNGPSPYDSVAMAEIVRTAEAAGIELAVRLPSGDPPLIRKVLDSGVTTIVVPQVSTAAEVREAIRASRFEYDGSPGRRGSSISRANRWGGRLDGYPEQADAAVIVGVMIENVQAMEQIEDILQVPELGFVRLGSGDMAVSVGHPIDRSAPAVTERREALVRACNRYDVPLSGNVETAREVDDLVDKGYRILTLGKDLRILRSVLDERVGAIRDHVAGGIE